MKKHIQTEWFFLVLVIIIIVILWLFSVIIWNITNLDFWFIDNQSEQFKWQQKYINAKNITYKFHTLTNTDGFWEDLTSCSGWLMSYHKEETPICQWGEIVNTSDNIDDAWDNDDFKASFYTGNILSRVTSDSDLYDNDDFARKYLIGVIPPKETKTVIFFNDALKDMISINPNNRSEYENTPQIPGQTQESTITLFWNFNHINGKISIYTFDKEIFNLKKELQYISHTEGDIKNQSGILSYSWSIDSWEIPYIFQINNFDYALVVENYSDDTVLTYQFEWYDEKKRPLYIVGLDDKNGFENRVLFSPELVENYYWYVIQWVQ